MLIQFIADMKIDFDTLIYIIVMIVFILLGAFGKKKKPVQQAPLPAEGEEDYVAPEDIIAEKLKAFLGSYDLEESKPATVQTSYKEEEIIDTLPEETFIDRYEEPLTQYKPDIPEEDEILDKVHVIHDEIQEGMPVFETYVYDHHSEMMDGDLTKAENQLADDTAYHFVKEAIYEDFDLNKAIIYSEIILRPRH